MVYGSVVRLGACEGSYVMHLQVQRATSSRHVGFDQETSTSHTDIHLKRMVYFVPWAAHRMVAMSAMRGIGP